MKATSRPQGWVYFIRSGDLVKIGYSTDVAYRARQLRTLSAGRCVLVAAHPGTQKDEFALHKRFSSLRQHGEWFIWCDEIANIAVEGFVSSGILAQRQVHPAIVEFKRLHVGRGVAAKALHELTKASLSFCEKVLAGSLQPGADMLVSLLQSDVGREVLIAIMGEARPKWWASFRKNLEIADALRAQAELARKIEAMQREMGE